MFEDLHWADAGLLDFIDHLLEWSRGVPILIVTLARPELLERRPDWGAGRRNFLALDLEPLPRTAMRELLAGLVPGLPAAAVARDRRARRRHPAVRGRDGPDARSPTGRLRRGRRRATSRSASSATLAVPETLHGADRGAPRRPRRRPIGRSLQDAAVLARASRWPGSRRSRAATEATLERAAPRPRPARAPDPGRRPAVARARAVRVRPGAHPRGRLRHARQARPPGAPPRGGPLLRVARRRRAGRCARGALPRRLRGRRRTGPRRDALAAQARLALAARPSGRSPSGRPTRRSAFLEQALDRDGRPG